MDKKNPNQKMSGRHQELIDQFHNSNLSPKEFVIRCLANRTVSAADAIDLMTVLKAKVLTRSFALADLSDDDFYRLGLYETMGEDVENNPLFVIQLNNSMREHSEAVSDLLEDFSRKLAELAARNQEDTSGAPDPLVSRQEAMDTILDTLSVDAVQH
ncbi:hypothetical protein M3P05_13125 [Sansalvadorimonas sp. 2012CJ34-2]|uniref:Uncharacterized protein n=1 Tax=Parendozoicomonas callyspongiae TaxID=2942213 RepID=A0ABT0PIN3_9GAMM|nr:hypothetical protein [Sansalvadorimonas sp. 2012CJ34-2]MCL6270866.1 hypothetical protein [Sansalvadorimonas sp. 2012CJ34-2]